MPRLALGWLLAASEQHFEEEGNLHPQLRGGKATAESWAHEMEVGVQQATWLGFEAASWNLPI